MLVQKIDDGSEVIFSIDKVEVKDRITYGFLNGNLCNLEPKTKNESVYIYDDNFKVIMSSNPNKWAGNWITFLTRNKGP